MILSVFGWLVGWFYWGFTSIQRYFSHIATWKISEIQVARRGIEPRPLAPQAKILTTRPPPLPIWIRDTLYRVILVPPPASCQIRTRSDVLLSGSAVTFYYPDLQWRFIIRICSTWRFIRIRSDVLLSGSAVTFYYPDQQWRSHNALILSSISSSSVY